MITCILHYWHGFLLIQLRGFSPERFLNLCSSNDIEIWDLSYIEGRYQFYMTVQGFRRIKPFARKSKVRLRILNKFGLPFFLYRNKERKLFFAGLASFFLILYLMSLFIWDIQFEGNQTYSYDTLVRFFETNNIHYGMPKSRVECEEIEAALRTEFSEITWVSARVSGTRLLVKIKENDVLSAVPVKDESPCDIVASCSGVITAMIVRRGTPMVEVGDQIEPGQILVKGAVTVTNDADEVIAVHAVHADADITARTEYHYTKTFPLLHEIQSETGKVRNGYYIKVLDYSALFLLPKKEGTMWKMFMEEEQLKLFQNFYLPVYLGKITGKEYITYETFYTKEEQKRKADQLHNNFIENLMEKGVQIIENNVKIQEDGSDCRIEGYVAAQESAGKIQSMPDRPPNEGEGDLPDRPPNEGEDGSLIETGDFDERN